MSKRNSRAAKAARRAGRLVNANRGPGFGPAGEIPVAGATPGCPMVPTEEVPLAEFVMPPGAVRLADDELPPGAQAAVQWYCRDGCGQDHVVVWARTC